MVVEALSFGRHRSRLTRDLEYGIVYLGHSCNPRLVTNGLVKASEAAA